MAAFLLDVTGVCADSGWMSRGASGASKRARHEAKVGGGPALGALAALALLLGGGASGCAAGRLSTIEARHALDLDRCTPRPTWPPSIPEQLEPPLGESERRALEQVPPEVLRVIVAGRMQEPVARLLRLRADPAADPVERVRVEIELERRMRSLTTELAATRFEVDCVGDQLESVRERLERVTSGRETDLTVASIALGALAGVVGGVWDLASDDARGPAWVQIVGGTASAALGIAALVPAKHALVLRHPRNLLAPIALGSDAERLYGTFVWRLLSSAPAGAEQVLRETIVERWRVALSERFGGDDLERHLALQVGDGGRYDADTLDAREALFDILENEVDAMVRELERLERYLRRLDAVSAPDGVAP